MIFILLLLLTVVPSLQAMSWFGFWSEKDYQKHIVFIKAYTTLSFKVEGQEKPIITYTDPFDKNNITYKWKLSKAQTALSTILNNVHAGLPSILKNDIIQSGKKEYFPSPELQKKIIPISNVYNMLCAFFQWQFKKDDEMDSNKDEFIINRTVLRQALCTRDTNQLKKLEQKRNDSYIENLFKESIQDYIRAETEKITITSLQQPNWFSQPPNYFPTIY
jgi:hypothetical protein